MSLSLSLFRVSSLLLGATLLSAVVQGCGCEPPPPPPPPSDEPTLSFAGLPQTVDCADDGADVAPDAPGFQIEVSIVLENDDGSGYTDVAVTNSRGDVEAGEGAFAGGTANVVITVVGDSEAPGAENTLTATASNSEGETITASATLRVICAEDAAAVPECRFVTPVNGDVLSADPAPVTVACSIESGDASQDQLDLVTSGTVTVTATNDAGDAESVQVQLEAGAGTDDLPLPAGAALTLDLVLDDTASLFAAPVTDSVEVTVDIGIAVQSIVVTEAGADNVLNVADNGGVEENGNVTSDVEVTFDSDVTGKTINGENVTGLCTGVGAGTSVTLTDCTFPQGSSDLVVSAPDGSLSSANNTLLGFFVDTVAPTAVISIPAEGQLLTGDDDVDSGVAGLQLDVIVSTSEDVVDEDAVIILVDGTAAAQGDAADGNAIITTTIPEGAHALTATVTDAGGNSVTSAARNVVVDSVAPTIAIDAPDAVTSADDKDGIAANGIQVDIAVTVVGGQGRPVAIVSNIDDVIDDGTCVAGADNVEVRCEVTFVTDAVHEVTASVSDENGNLGVSLSTDVDAQTGLIGVRVTSPPIRNGFRSISSVEDTVAGAGTAEFLVTGTTAPGGVVSLIINGVAQLGATATADGTGAFTMNATLSEGQTGTFEVRVQSGIQTGTSGISNFRVDVGRPTAVITSPPSPATFGAAQDTSGAPGLQANITVAVTECEDGVIEVREGTTLIGSNDTVPAAGNGSFTVAVNDATDGAATWTATCTDVDANTTQTPGTLDVNVDATPPAAPAITIVVDDLRRGVIDVRYTQPGDDGNTGNATTITAFLSRDTAITDKNFGTGNQIALTVPNGSTPGGTAIGPDAVQTAPNVLAFDHVWHVAIRAVDDVGNRSFATASVNLATTETVLTSAAVGYGESLSRSTGDINNDGFQDFVVGAPGINQGGDGGFEVVLGAATAAGIARTFVAAPANMTCTIAPCTPREVGYAVNIIDSINGDAFDDVVVVGYDDTRFDPEIVMIYAGSASGIAANATPVSFLEASGFTFAGYHVQSVGDVDDDGDSDWVIPVQGEENVYLFLNTGAFPASGTIAARASTRIFDSGTSQFASATTSLDRGDGSFDIVVSSTSPGTLFVVAPRATWPATLDVRAGGSNVTIVDVVAPDGDTPGFDLQRADLDGDGDDDLLLATTGGVASLTNTAGSLGNEVEWAIDVETSIGVLGAGDFNLDGRDDISGGGDTPNAIFFGVSPITPHAADVVYGETGLLFPLAAHVVGEATTGADYVYAEPATASVTIRN